MNESKYKKFRELISRKDINGLKNFYKHLHNENLELQDKNEYYHQFLMQFLNLEEHSDCTNNKEEPNSEKNYICIRTIFNENFYIDNFYTKKELRLHPYWFNSILFYNNLVQAETYLHIYEFSEPSLDSIKQCNNLIVSVKQKEVFPFYSECWMEEYKETFKKLHILPRNVLSNGKEFIFVFDLMRSVNLKIDSVKLFYETIERKLNKEFASIKNEFIMLPGSICRESKLIFTKKPQFNQFQNRQFLNGELYYLETGFQKCSYQGIPFYNGDSVNLSSLGSLFETQKRNTEQITFIENRKRYTNVGLQRLQDFAKLLELRNYNLLKERRDYFEILSNVMFYLEKDFIFVLNKTEEINKELLYPLKEKTLYSIVEFQYKKYLEYKKDALKGIKYTNEVIVKKLGITFDEQDSMLQLITKDTAKLRKNYRDREYSKKHYIKKEKAKIEENNNNYVIQIQDMLGNGYSKTEISKILHISRNTVTKIAHNMNISFN